MRVWDQASTIAISSRLRESSGGLNPDQLLSYDHEDQALENTRSSALLSMSHSAELDNSSKMAIHFFEDEKDDSFSTLS